MTSTVLHNIFSTLQSKSCFREGSASGNINNNGDDPYFQDFVATKDESLDMLTWCMVGDEDGEEQGDDEENRSQDDNDEVHLFYPTAMGGSNDYANTLHHRHHRMAPLRIFYSSDGFAHISKAKTVNSTNGTFARAPEHQDVWVVKVNKRRATSPRVQEDEVEIFKKIARDVSTSLPPTSHNIDIITSTSETRDEEEVVPLYMSMTEHELFKSSKETKIKDCHVAARHDHSLARALGCCPQGDIRRIDTKAIRLNNTNLKKAQKSEKTRKSRRSNVILTIDM
ncbi:hypothetical protein EDD11_006065 [Mortierella claussenii]|nr:hypothetical protein EDD11_006065 [Mortierella claussenii]